MVAVEEYLGGSERHQPSSRSGGQSEFGIRDHVYLVRPYASLRSMKPRWSAEARKPPGKPARSVTVRRRGATPGRQPAAHGSRPPPVRVPFDRRPAAKGDADGGYDASAAALFGDLLSACKEISAPTPLWRYHRIVSLSPRQTANERFSRDRMFVRRVQVPGLPSLITYFVTDPYLRVPS